MKTYTYDGDNYKDFLNALEPKAKLLFDVFMQKYDKNTLWSNNALILWQSIFAPYGITFDYGLDLEPYDINLTIKK